MKMHTHTLRSSNCPCGQLGVVVFRFGLGQVVRPLQVKPKARIRTKVPSEPDRRIGR
jgi:hypothetical protein